MGYKFIKIPINCFLLIFVFYISCISFCHAQDNRKFLEKSDTLVKSRVFSSSLLATSTYTAFTVGLYSLWYKNYDQSSFHLFNDYGEWNNMDKYGHFYTSYFQSVLVYKGAKWTGMKDNSAIWLGMGLGTLFQSTLEVMDGFSTEWGFSLPDIAFNFAGVATMGVQQKYWGEQRIIFKVNSLPITYSEEVLYSVDGLHQSSLYNRANNLFGEGYFNRFLKDYNAQVLWASVNIKSFLPVSSNFPNWLNVSIGYSAENMFGGYENSWIENGSKFVLDNSLDRFGQFYISPDIDLWRIRTKSHLFNSFLDIFNVFKIPMPAIEINTKGEFHFHIFR